MMSARFAFIFAAAALGGCDKLPFSVSKEERATRACEERLKSDLTSPASYRRVWSGFTPAGPVTKPEMIEGLEANRERAAKVGNDAEALSNAFNLQCMKNPKRKNCEGLQTFEQLPHPDTAFVLVEYEAANAFNAKLPGFFSCRMIIRDSGKYDQASIFTSTAVPTQLGKQLKSQAEFINSNARN